MSLFARAALQCTLMIAFGAFLIALWNGVIVNLVQSVTKTS
jgi:flagellar biosynthesis protein FliQ